MAQSIDSKKFGTLDTSGRVPVSLTGVGDDPALGLGLSFNIGGKDYTFIPEDRITKGAASGTNGALFTGFLNPTLLSSLKNSSDYVDLSGTQIGSSFQVGNFISDKMGGSTKGFLAPKEVVDPILAAGITTYNPEFAGKASGIGSANGKPAFILPSGYADDSGQVTKTETKITGYTSSGGGWLNSFANNPLGTVSNTVSNFVASPSQSIGQAWNTGGRDAAILAGTIYGANALAAGGAGAAGAGAGAGAGAAGTAAAADLAAAYGATGAGVGAGTAAGIGAAGVGAAAAGAAQAQAAIDAAGVAGAAGTGAGAAGATAAGAAQAQAGIDAATAAGAGVTLPAAAAAGTASWMMPAAIVGSSLIGANAAQKAAQTQADAAAQANQLLAQTYATQRADLAPFTAAGLGAQNKLLTFLGLPGGTAGADYGKYTKDFTGADLLAGQDPGYAFRLSEGQKALERSAAARGGLLSGGTGKALTSYGQQMGSQEYQNAYNRYQTNRSNQLAPLFTLTGSGQASAAGQAAAAGNYATGAANNLTSAGAARAAGDVGTVNALTGGLNTYLGYTSQQDLLNAYNARTAAAKSAYS